MLVGLSTSLVCAQQKPLSADTLHWSSSRPLTWDDFKGKPIGGIGFFGEAYCQNAANFEKASTFSKTKTTVTAIFDRRNSWVDPTQKTDQGLLYFQVMFNLFEVHARELRKKLKETKLGMNPTKVFQQLHGESMSMLSDEYGKFREETGAGSDLSELNRWDALVQQKLWNLQGN